MYRNLKYNIFYYYNYSYLYQNIFVFSFLFVSVIGLGNFFTAVQTLENSTLYSLTVIGTQHFTTDGGLKN